MDIFTQYESNVRGYIRSFPAVFDTATSATITDVTGTDYIDFFAGAGSLNYGHNHPKVKAALIEYMQRDGIGNALDTATTAKQAFIRNFQEVVLQPRKLDYKIQFVGPTGANAVETALKLARKCKQRSNVIAFTNAYHGHSLGALAVTGNEFYHDDYYGVPQNVDRMPFDNYITGDFNSIEMLRQYMTDNSSGYNLPAAVIVESIQGEGGINVASADWLARLSEFCQEFDILLILDEIQVGNGRTGDFFSFERANIHPDIVTVSKSIGTGLPMSIVLIKPEIDVWSPGEHTGTFRGNSHAFVAANAVLSLWKDEQFSQQIKAKGQIVAQYFAELKSIYADYISDVRGLGMIWGIESSIEGFCSLVSQSAFKRGLLMETAGADNQVLKFLAPLVITDAELTKGFSLLKQAIDDAIVLHQQGVK